MTVVRAVMNSKRNRTGLRGRRHAVNRTSQQGSMKTARRSRLLMVEISINGLSDWIARGWPNVKFDSTPEGSFRRGCIDTGAAEVIHSYFKA